MKKGGWILTTMLLKRSNRQICKCANPKENEYIRIQYQGGVFLKPSPCPNM